MNYQIKFTNGVTKKFLNLNAIDAGTLIQNDENNICIKCKRRPVLKALTISNKIGRYNPGWIEIDSIWYRTIDVEGQLCRGCRIHDTSVQNIRNWELSNPEEYNKLHEEMGRALGKDYEIQAKAKLASALNSHQSTDIMNLYYAEVLENSDVYKIGISQNLDNRLHKSATGYYKDKYTLSKIISGTNELISNLEYNIKLKFGLRDFDLGTEFINKSDLNLVINFSNEFKL